MAKNKQPEFYVGYLPIPPALKWTVRGLVVLLAGLIAFDAWLVASFQPDAGDGYWADTPTQYTGTLNRAPYPMLRVSENGTTRTFILISDEKRGAEAVLGNIPDGASVKINAYEVKRAAVSLLQLAATDVTVASAPTVAAETVEIVGPAELTGEIVDSKCWLGVMRPGDGHIHKACATLCIRGGIPPMFVLRGGEGPQVYVLTLADGRAIPPAAILDYIADPVRLSGIVEKQGALFYFKVDLSSLARLE
ncbi:MAG: DUF1415 domain-containing protein [Alphaproteobacteria bacterium]|nr:DUF1415 domain-containing protein [Alphaproteobacteria bacterium]